MGRTKASYNIHDYVKNASSTFDEKAFNEIDGLVLTQISNMDLGNSGIGLYSNNSKSFADIWTEMNTEGTAAHASYLGMSEDNRALIKELATSTRYKNLTVSNFVKDPVKTNVKGFESVGSDCEMEQFAAATITYQQDGKTYSYVSYRATDGTSDGWSEDLAMLYSMNTQAQSDSVAYMNIVAGMTEGPITGGGHSKGGNDFEYAYLFCDDEVRARIVKGYVYDSPGLTNEVLSKTKYYDDYLEITNGSFVCPQDSIIGQLLHEGNNALFVHSVESGFNQHDPYSWELDPNSDSFVPDEQTELSKRINKALDDAVANMSPEERAALFAFVSYLLYNNTEKGGLDGLMELFGENWKNDDGSFNWHKLNEIWDVIYADWINMTPEERQAFIDSLGTLVAAFAATAYDYAKEEIEKWIEKKVEEIKQKIEEAWQAASAWVIEKREAFRNFLTNVYQSVVSGFNKVAGWIRKYSTGGKYAAANPYFKVDTFKLRDYANRLQNVNRRLANLDRRMDGLYRSVGLLDLWNLLQADLHTNFSWRLLRAAVYLNETASDFESVESELSNA